MPPISLLVKPASGSCNMRCRYCFYTDETENRTVPSMGVMSIETMKTMVDKALTFADGDCSFAFQGGEPSLAGLPFFRALTDYVKNHPNPKKVRVHYSFQTNGYNLNEDWAKWFVENQVLVGISQDGPKEI
ncbi:MAG: radical SAM protein, partial [Lachnospiraceae bacterium]|nr:radical SAM protein [Lachnospiraceae bacterium]